MSTEQRWLVVGASGGIARAIIEQGLSTALVHVTAVSRRDRPSGFPEEAALDWHRCDYSEEAVRALIHDWQAQGRCFDRVIITNGQLHGPALQPEKKLEDLHGPNLHLVYEACAVVPMRWVAGLLPVLKGARAPQLVVFSARVGSLSDNCLGGWYAYRAAKAALNMLMKTASIEYRRRLPACQLLVFHPGTTDTALSAPFQGNVPSEKLFSPAFVAARLESVLATRQGEETLAFVDWDGKVIPW